MAIRITCACNKQLKLKDALAGKRIKCPACGMGLTVARPDDVPTANGHAALHPDESSPFVFDSPVVEAVPAAAPSPPPAAPGAEPEANLSTPEAGDSARRRRAILIAIVAAFSLMVTALGIVVVMLLTSASDRADAGGNGLFADGGDNRDKLRLEEEEKLRREADARYAAESAIRKQNAETKRLAVEQAKRVNAAQADEKRRLENEAREGQQKKAREDAESLRIEEAKKRAVAVKKLVAEGRNALTAGEAEKAKLVFEQAAKIDPRDRDARSGLARATREVKKVQTARKHRQLVEAGQKSFQEKKYDLAVSSLKLALELEPSDSAAADALKKAEAEKLKLDAPLGKILSRGYKALERHQLVAADKIFDEGEKLAPGHPKVVEAKRALANERNRLRDEARVKKEREEQARRQRKKDREDFDKYVKQGRDALKAKQYAAAERDLTIASKLVPDDQVAKALLRQARDGQAAETRKRLAKAREQAAALVVKGKKALEDKLFQEAVDSLSRANALVPGDKATLALLAKANDGLKKQLLASAKERSKADEDRKAERARKLFELARQSLKDKKYDSTDKLLDELVKLVPNDPDILAIKQDLAAARKAIQDERARLAAQAAEADRKKLLGQFDAKMKKGRAALDGAKFDDAIEAYTEALKLVKNQKAFADREKKAGAALDDAKAAKAKNDKLKLKLDQ